jgi:hypothetical protein
MLLIYSSRPATIDPYANATGYDLILISLISIGIILK